MNNMSTKTWQEEKIKHTAEHLGIISEGALNTLISDIRKHDEEELIKMLPYKEYDHVMSDGEYANTVGHNYALNDFKQLIKDYYAK